MPISDTYVVQYVLQATQAPREPLVWKEKDPCGYAATLGGAHLELDSVASRTGSRLYLSLISGSETVHIEEPFRTGFFGRTYESEDHRRLADLMKTLAEAVAAQCAARTTRSDTPRVRQLVFRRLIGAADLEPQVE